MIQNNLYSVLENWYNNVFVKLKFSKIKTDNNLTHQKIPKYNIAKTTINDGHIGLYGWKHIIQQTKTIVEDIIQDQVIPNMQLIYYPKNGYMNWHTNSDNPSTRIYLVKAEQNPLSEMRFENKIIKDNPLWSFNIFKIEDKTWHCVNALTPRLSLGFHYQGNKTIKELKELLNA
jgi:hypothetical protein